MLKLIDAKSMTYLVREIEDQFPGYWYSISQKETAIRISLGPSMNCILDLDRAWATLPTGDKGLHTYFDPREEFDAEKAFSQMLSIITQAREDVLNAKVPVPAYVSKPRKHSQDDLKRFRKRYNNLVVEGIPKIVSNGLIVHEVYIGSCTLSVDVSIRGNKQSDNKPFDTSVDLIEDSILSQSIDLALSKTI